MQETSCTAQTDGFPRAGRGRQLTDLRAARNQHLHIQPRPGRGEWPDPEETWNPEQDAARRHLFLPHLSIRF